MEPPLLGREEDAGPASLEGGAGAFSEVWSFSGRQSRGRSGFPSSQNLFDVGSGEQNAGDDAGAGSRLSVRGQQDS